LFSDFLDSYPDVTLHVANLGGTLPMVIERMDNVTLTRTPNQVLPSSKANRVHVDSSSLGPKSIELATAIFGADRILFGTDCPIFITERSLNAVTEANISDFDKKLILTDNAETLLTTYI
jgi:predicted TIM-barrel fold metal-dependent hydrolase